MFYMPIYLLMRRDLAGEKELECGDESRAGPGYEAMEELCSHFGRLVARLHALGLENCKKPSEALP